MARGEKTEERRGGKESGLRPVPDRRATKSEPRDFEEDPDQDPGNCFDEPQDTVDDEYIWPTYEEDEDD